MKQQTTRFINVRLSLFCVFGLILGIYSFHEVLFGNFLPLILSCVAILAAIVVFACLKRRKTMLCFVVILVFVFVGFCEFWIFRKARKEDSVVVQQCVVTGRVTDIGRNGEAKNVLYLENCTADGEKLKGRVKLVVFDGSEFETGDIVTASGTLRNVFVVLDEVDTYSVRQKVHYELNQLDSLEKCKGEMTLPEKVRRWLFEVTDRYMPQNGDVAYALLSGDRNALNHVKKDSYIEAGIIHLLVVSGLHVGFIVSVLAFVLNKFKLKSIYQLPILLVPLLFYAYICNFSPSIVRAIVMTVCLYITKSLFSRYDLLTSLCWAVLVILTVNPLYLFDVGFQLSALSVFGIATLYLQIERLTAQRHFHKIFKWLISVLSMSFSCISATLFVSAFHFHQVVWVGLIVNVVAIPIVFVAFVLCVVGLLPWVFHYALWLADKILQGVTVTAEFLFKLNLSIPIKAAAVGIAVSVLLLFVLGGYVNLSKRYKKIYYSVCSLVLVICIAVGYIPPKYKNSVMVFMDYTDVAMVATSTDKDMVIVSDFHSPYLAEKVSEQISRYKPKSISLFFADYSAANVSTVGIYFDGYDVSQVYLLDSSANDIVSDYFYEMNTKVTFVPPNSFVNGSISVQNVYDAGLSAAIVTVGELSVATVFYEGEIVENFWLEHKNISYLVFFGQYTTVPDINASTISFYQQQFGGNFGLNKYGNFTITEKDGKIELNFRKAY